MPGTLLHARGTAALPLPGQRYGVAISWDHLGGAPVDVDLQACIVDSRGTIIDAVYYNNMKALKSVTHSGDETTGEKAGHDEVIWVSLTKLPPHVQMLIFVVAVHGQGHLRDVPNGMIHLLQDREENEVGRIPMERSMEQVDVVATMLRASGSWHFQVVDEPARGGKHFMDVLEPTIGNLIRQAIPGAPRRQKVAFAMDKGAVLDLPQSSTLRSVTAGLGWDLGAGGQGIDLDVSAVLMDAQARHIDTVFFGRLRSCGLTHSGDNLTGAGEGDDEQIHCDLTKVPPNVEQIFFCVHIYTRGPTFQQVKNPYCRITDSSGDELARYLLREAGTESGLLIARLFKEGVDRWGFQALGSFSSGSLWRDSLPEMVRLCKCRPRDLQVGRSSSLGFSGAQAPRPWAGPEVVGVPNGPQSAECCAPCSVQ